MSQSPKILGLWKHEPGSKTFDPLKTWTNVQNSIHRTSRKHVQIQIYGPLGSTSKIQSLDLWEACPRFQSIGPLGSTSKLQSIKPLGSTSKIPNHRTSRKHIQTSIHRTSGKHVQNSIFGPLGSTSKIPIHRTSGKHVQNFKSIRPLVSMSCTYFFIFYFLKKKKKSVACMNYI